MSATPQSETIHKAPPEGRSHTPCCGSSPFELPLTDRMTLDWDLVTCWPVEERREIAAVGASLADFLAAVPVPEEPTLRPDSENEEP